MKNMTSQFCRVVVLGAVLATSAAGQLVVQTPTFSFEAVTINGKPVKKDASGKISAYRGDVILCEVYVRDWSPNQELLRSYFATFDDTSWTNGDAGFIKPMDHDQTAAIDIANDDNVFIDDLHPGAIAKLRVLADPLRYRFMGFFPNIDDARLHPQDGTKSYCGSIVMKVSNDAAGTFTLRLDEKGSGLDDSKRQRIAPIDFEHLDVQVLTNVLRVIQSTPPTGSINARQTQRPGSGWDRAVLLFDADPKDVAPSDLQVSDGTHTPPRVQRVVVDGKRLTVVLDRPISRGRWTVITHTTSGTSTRLASLPGDTTGDGMLNREDVLAVFAEPGDTETPLYRVDVDGDGRRGLGDALRAIDLLQEPEVHRTDLLNNMASKSGRLAVQPVVRGAKSATQSGTLNPTFSLEAVAVNGVSVLENSRGDISVNRGDVIVCEIYLRDWSPDGELLRGYQADLEDPSWISGNTGSIKPVGHEETAAKAVANEGNVFIDAQHPRSIFAKDKRIDSPDKVGYRFMGMVTNPADARLSPQDGTKYYCGTVRMKVSSNASGTFTLRLDVANSLLLDPESQGIIPIDYEHLKVHVLSNVLRVVSSTPPAGSINARHAHRPGIGWDRVVLTFDATTEAITPTDFAVEDGTPSPPRVQRVVSDGKRLTVVLDRPINAGHWTSITHTASGTGTRVGSLPGDTTGNGLLDRDDVFGLLVTTGDVMRPLHQVDVNGDGRRNVHDALRTIELLQDPNVHRAAIRE